MPNAAIKRFRCLPEDEQSRVIEMAWEDRTPFDAIERQFGLGEPEIIDIMRYQLKPGSFRLWRQRVAGRTTKHRALRSPDILPYPIQTLNIYLITLYPGKDVFSLPLYCYIIT